MESACIWLVNKSSRTSGDVVEVIFLVSVELFSESVPDIAVGPGSCLDNLFTNCVRVGGRNIRRSLIGGVGKGDISARYVSPASKTCRTPSMKLSGNASSLP